MNSVNDFTGLGGENIDAAPGPADDFSEVPQDHRGDMVHGIYLTIIINRIRVEQTIVVPRD